MPRPDRTGRRVLHTGVLLICALAVARAVAAELAGAGATFRRPIAATLAEAWGAGIAARIIVDRSSLSR